MSLVRESEEQNSVENLYKLLDTLKLIWQNFCELTAEEGNNAERQHWMQLFLYYWQFVHIDELQLQQNDSNKIEEFTADLDRFVKSVPEEAFAYLLECVCDIINQSEQTSESFFVKHNFSQLLTPYDCNKIVALRTFLTHQLGHHLLLFLLQVDIKLIASQKSLCNLCLCLFPSCTWDQQCSIVLQQKYGWTKHKLKTYELVDDFRLLQLTLKKPNHHKSGVNKNYHHFNNDTYVKNKHLNFEEFCGTICSSDEIAYLLLKLLEKSIKESYAQKQDAFSDNNNLEGTPNVSTVLRFILQKLCSNDESTSAAPNIDSIAASEQNCLFLKWQLLHLLVNCLNAQFAQDAINAYHLATTNMLKNAGEILNSTDFTSINGILYAAWTQLESAPNLLDYEMLRYGFAYLWCGMLHNVLVLHTQVLMTPITSNTRRNWLLSKNLYARELFGVVCIDGWLAMLKLLLMQQQQQQQQYEYEHDEVDEEINNLSCIILRLLMNISDLFTNYDQKLLIITKNSQHKMCKNLHLLGGSKNQQHHINDDDNDDDDNNDNNNCDINEIIYKNNNSGGGVGGIVVARLQRKKLQYIQQQQIHCTTLRLHAQQQNEQNYQLWSCYFQNMLFDLFTVLSQAKQQQQQQQQQQIILHGLMRANLCCCNYTYQNVAQLLKLIQQQQQKPPPNAAHEKNVYKLLQRKFLPAVFSRRLEQQQLIRYKKIQQQHQQQQQQQQFKSLQQQKCNLCEQSFKSLEFHAQILEIYKTHAQLLLNCEQSRALLFLRHLRHIGKYMPYDIANVIIAEIVLPVFRTQKQLMLMDGNQAATRLLQECLQVFASYLHDIRLIKAFYCEENIKHLEDLLTAASLVKQVLQLIKIGIESGNFLGDAACLPREQFLLSQRLISLQLNSSRWAGQSFQRLLRRLWLTQRALWPQSKTRYFWFGENSQRTEAAAHSLDTLSALQILQTCSLQWGLNNELLKNSAQFYSKFAKSYSIVLEEYEEEEQQREEPLDLTVDKLPMTTQTTAEVEQNQTILDILQLNYNALSGFLLILPKKMFEKQKGNKNELEMQAGMQQEHSFLVKLLEAKMETVHIYNVKWSSLECRVPLKSNLNSKLSAAIASGLAAAQKHDDILFESENTVDNSSMLSKILNIFGNFFYAPKSVRESEQLSVMELQQQQQWQTEFKSFYETNSDSKKLLLQLFETTMTICVRAYHNEDADKMQRHLRKLKTLILESATNNWQIHSEKHARDNEILKTLQTLLKIAEMMGELQRNDEVTTSTTSSGTAHNAHLERRSRPQTTELCLTPENRTPSSLSASLYGVAAVMDDDSDGDLSDYEFKAIYGKPHLNRNLPDPAQISPSAADEGYDADAEIADSSVGCESDVPNNCLESTYDARTLVTSANTHNTEYWQGIQPASRYRSHNLHSGLCRLIVEVLMELSQLCAQQTGVGGWCESLAQLTNRLFVVRECLGGPLFLLHGFAPLLRCNDVKLKELQQCVLELITDLNTPDLLVAYFAIMASPNPPMEILVNYMGYICMGSLMRRPCPTTELEFPVIIDGKFITSLESTITVHLERIRNYHLQSQIMTPFTRAACLMPITHTRLWTEHGFTLSTWLQAKVPHGTHKSHEDELRCLTEDNCRQHIFSIGSDQALLSVYLTNNLTLLFETSRPNAELKTKRLSDPFPTTSAGKVVTPSAKSMDSCMNGANSAEEYQHSTETLDDAEKRYKSKSQFRNALRQTKMMIMNHFSQMHFFHNESLGDASFESSVLNLKDLRLVRNKWTHLVLAVKPKAKEMQITVCINALERHEFSLPFSNLLQLIQTHHCQVVALGNGHTARVGLEDSRSTLDVLNSLTTLRYSLSNLMIFHGYNVDPQPLMNLTAMGPDYVELNHYQVGNWKANYSYLQLSRMQNANFGNTLECLKFWRDRRLLIYSAQTPTMFTGYDWIVSYDSQFANCGRAYSVLLYAELIQSQLPSLQTAVTLSGGLSTLLYMFARVVETSSDAHTQANALDILLKAALADSQLYTEFMRQDYMSLIGHVIRTENCTKDVRLLRSIINNACNQPLITRECVNDNTNACIAHPRLWIAVLQRYIDWHRAGSENSLILDTLLQCVLALTREKHPHRDFNMEQFQRAGLINVLLNLCKVYVIESPNPVYISTTAAAHFVSIISVFAGSPPSSSLMDELMKLLLLLQRPSDCYITHDLSKFYFLLSTRLQSKNTNTPNKLMTPFRRSFMRPAVHTPAQALAAYNSTQNTRKYRKYKHPLGNDFRKPVEQFVQNLEQVADCKHLNQSATRLLSPQQVSNWQAKYKQNNNKGKSATSPSITHKRLRFGRSKSAEPNKSNLDFTKRTLQYLLGDNGLKTCRRNLSKPSTSSGKPNEPQLMRKEDFYNSAGIIELKVGLFRLLKDFLCLLPDTVVDDVLKHYIKVEYLLILANHESCQVRTAIIQLLATLTKRVNAQDVSNYAKHYFPQHLANQLCKSATDQRLFEACLQWVTGIYGNLQVVKNTEVLRIQHRFGLNALLACITNTVPNKSEFLLDAFQVLYKMFTNNDPEEQLQLIEVGLIQCSIKALYNLYVKLNLVNSEPTEQAIASLLLTIGEFSLRSVGHITIIWDILNILSWYQDHQALPIVQAIRAVQAQLQLHWLKSFFDPSYLNTPDFSLRYKLQTLKHSTLTMSETRTRLDLLIDRSTQFFIVCDVNYTLTRSELDLYKWLVHYGIIVNQRCSSLLTWGLRPTSPQQLRVFIVDCLWHIFKDNTLSSLICDGKMLKSLLWYCRLADPQQPIEHLEELCQHLNVNDTDTALNFNNEIDRIEMQHLSALAKQKEGQERTLQKFNVLATNCMDSSMLITRRVADVQNAERKALMHHMKDYDEYNVYNKWLEIIRRMSHEGAPWYCKERSENSWELDTTEGPSRVHTRLRRCHLDIDPRFFMKDFATNESKINEYSRPLEYLITSYDQQLNISLDSQILYNFSAKYLPVDGEIDGEIIITDQKLYFIATYHCKYFYVSCDICNIAEIWLKRYQHKETAFEIFLDFNQSLFFALQNQEHWKIIKEVFCDKIVSPPDANKITLITQQWREGLLTNWEYLMALNQISGRTYNDLMQYPVFPWILSNYNEEILDLQDIKHYRKLEKPIAVQYESNEHHYVNNYMYINSTMTNMGSITLKPYHYSSHYSNSGTVLHFMVRVPPFTSYFLRYQDNNFDLPDRTFHSLNTTWNLASRDSPTDVKELIPEFFCLPEMFENFERFDFGCRQNGERVEDVLMPPWCKQQARLFVLIHRQALESEYVRSNLHNWIDLIFGYKQTGEAAIDAINVFHPATYSVFMDSEILDPIERKAVETMVRTYGQMPRQLFKTQHPSTKPLTYRHCAKEVLPNIRGLRWGIYVGSPQLPTPSMGNVHKLPGADQLIAFHTTNTVYGLSQKSCVMQGAEVDTYNVVSWGSDDHIVRIAPLNKTQAKPKNLLYDNPFDAITACGACAYLNQLWLGHKSGRISVYKCQASEVNRSGNKGLVRGLRLSYNSAVRKILTKSSGAHIDADGDNFVSSSTDHGATLDGQHKEGADCHWSGPTVLIRHTDQITCISLSLEFKIAVTAGRDGIAVIWDLNNWSYVRTIERPAEFHLSSISLLAISSTLGDIVTVHTQPQNTSNNESAEEGSEVSFAAPADECFEVTEENTDDFVNVYMNPNGKSLLRLHTINGRYVQHFFQEERILAVCCSYVKEGVGVNVIATAIEGGIVRLWSSWNLHFVSEIITGSSNIKSIVYSTHQNLIVLTKESYIQVWEADGLTGNPPKFPQMIYK